MKLLFIRLILAITASVIILSCKKDNVPVKPLTRTVNFNLYTEKDFSSNEDSITFTLFIRDGSKVLFDSVAAKMKIKEVPVLANKLKFKKSIFYNNTDLIAGFKYEIKNVGYSWYTAEFKAGEVDKEVNFSFK